jgi:hypothetical protein
LVPVHFQYSRFGLFISYMRHPAKNRSTFF